MFATKALRGATVMTLFFATSFFSTSAAQTPPQCFGRNATIFNQSGKITGTENPDVIVGSAQRDTIKGLGGDDFICGLGGNDKLLGGDDNDGMAGGAGDDVMDGGGQKAGAVGDGVGYSESPDRVKIDLALGIAEGEGDDTLRNVESIDGSRFNDTLRGDTGPNFLSGLEGDDVIFGRAGKDKLYGNEDGDIMSPGSGNDYVEGGEGDDTLSYRGAPAGVEVDLGNHRATGGWDIDELELMESVAGSDFPDHLVGNEDANLLLGYKGDDLLEGGAGKDTLDGGADDDIMRSGAGDDAVIGGDGDGDTASYEDAYGDVTANLATGVAAPDGFGGSDTLSEVENLTASYGVVRFTGDAKDNVLIGCDNADTIDGGGGNDTIRGGLSDDTLNGGGGQDHIYGESGDDTIHGGTEDDDMYGGTYIDTIYGDEGTDLADGGDGGDPNLLENDTCDAEDEERCERNPSPRHGVFVGAVKLS